MNIYYTNNNLIYNEKRIGNYKNKKRLNLFKYSLLENINYDISKIISKSIRNKIDFSNQFLLLS